jgi:4-hydroxymandelate oxidase
MAQVEPYVLQLGYWSLHQIEAAARAKMSAAAWHYVSDVAEDGVTSARERRALESIVLRQRVLADATPVELSTTVLAQKLAMPIIAAPTSAQGMVHSEAEVGTVRGCSAAGTLAVISSASTRSIEEIGQVGAPWWVQLYPNATKSATKEFLARAAASGAVAAVLTVDVPVLARRRFLPRGYAPADWKGPDAALSDLAAGHNLTVMASNPFTWDDVYDIKASSSIPVLLKGVLDPRDAALAADAGVAGIVVSTHGGRQLDGAPSPAEVLPAIADIVQERCVILADGSVRRGSHVLRLLARGASAVLVGRPVLWGLACGGAGGVRDVMEILRAELATAMALTGCRNVSAVTPDIEWHGPTP